MMNKTNFLLTKALVWDWCQESFNAQTTFCNSFFFVSFSLSNFSSHLCYIYVYIFPCFLCVSSSLLFRLMTAAIRSNMNEWKMGRKIWGKAYKELFCMKKEMKKNIPWPNEARNFSSSHFFFYSFIPSKKEFLASLYFFFI